MNTPNVRLAVHSSATADEDPIRIINDLKELLRDNETIKIRQIATADGNVSVESRAEPVSLTAIALAFVSGGALRALIEAFVAVSRNARTSSVEYDLELADGDGKLSLKTTNLTSGQTASVLEQWNAMLEKVSDRKSN